VQALRARGDLHPGLPSIRCVGYRQAWEALDAGLQGRALHDDLMARGMAATRQLAKRQLTWLRSMQRLSIAADGEDPVGQVRNAVLKAWPGLAHR
jgi:tRNA dimethylallyltransferase